MRIFILILLFITQPLFASGHYFIYPEIALGFLKSAPKTIFYGEGLRVPVHLHYHLLRDRAWWALPTGSYLQVKSGPCPSLAWGRVDLGIGECYMDLVIPANTPIGKTVSGVVTYYVDGSTWDNGKKYVWSWRDWRFSTAPISVTVIPHPLSMNLIPIQYATANESFVYNLKQAVRYYDENMKADNKIQAIVSPQEIDGLSFDPTTFSIVGKPQRIGTYTFTVGAKNKISTAQATEFKVIVSPRLKDKPVFRHAVSLLTALPNQNYKLNLLELLEENKGFMLNNQIHFSLVNIGQNADWLSVSDKEQTLLQGKAPAHLAGQEISASLIASSNTGGDSEPPIPLRCPLPTTKQKNLSSNLLIWSSDQVHRLVRVWPSSLKILLMILS